jgi:NAD(P)-dependent dehydrogenase (short-subunit alcohol dehydrogenase family)
MSLQDRVMIVTGASRGIGLATAQMLAAAGAHVFGVARTTPAVVVPGVTFMQADVRQRADVERVVKAVLDETGRIDTLVNNAGIEVVKPLSETTDTEYDQMLDTNLKGPYFFSKAVLPVMQRQHAGHLIFVNSVSGVRGFAEDAVYCASKHGLTGLADALGEELRKHGIRVTSIHPGATDTPLAFDSWSPPDDPRRPYFLKAEDVAEAVVYAASQPPHVVIKQIVIQPLIEPSYSEFLPLDIVNGLLNQNSP